MRTRLPERGERASFAFSVSPADMRAFCELSGDDNPVHWDPKAAARCGLAAPAVYGGLLMARISRLLGVLLPGHGCVWMGTRTDFLSPLFVNEEAQLEGEVIQSSPAVRMVKISHVIRCGERVVLKGTSEAVWQGGPCD